MPTRAQYYKQRYGGLWRSARVPHRCDWRKDGMRCMHQIQVGERYFDTKLPNPNSSNPHAGYRICEACANEVITL